MRTHRTPPRTLRPLVRTGLAVALVAAVAACGDDDGSAGPTTEPDGTTTTTTAAPTTTEDDGTTTTTEPDEADVESEVLAAYEASWTATAAAYDPIDPNHPSLAAHLTDDVLASARQSLGERLESRRSLRGTFGFSPRVDSVDDDEAVVVDDCFTDDGEEYDVDTGAVVDTFETRSQVRVTMRLEDGTWKRAEQERTAEQCA